MSSPQSVGSKKRKRISQATNVSDADEAARRNQPVKRACNECRQQKLRCNVQTEPEFEPCARCIKHNLHCAIDLKFRREEKRAKNQELERELAELKEQYAGLRARFEGLSKPDQFPLPQAAGPSLWPNATEAAASRSLLDLAQGGNAQYPSATAIQPTLYSLQHITLSEGDISELFDTFFNRYHPYLPLLSPEQSPQDFFDQSPLLYWTIIAVASRRYSIRQGLLIELKQPLTDLQWDTIRGVPQNYHFVKALCLLCTWPLPTNSTSLDPSVNNCGLMVASAMQFGLHRPSHAQDFSRTKVDLGEEDIKDRMNTWVAVNVTAQNISTGYGMPQMSRWNWYTHGLHLERIKDDFRIRCQIERFVDKVTRTLYTMQRDLIVPQPDEAHKALTIDTFARELDELDYSTRAANPTPLDVLYLHAAGLHLRLVAFFDSPTAPTYRSDLAALYIAATTFLKTFLALPPRFELPIRTPQLETYENPASPYATNYVMQMTLAAGFTLLKLLNSFFATQVDPVSGRTIFQNTVEALRSLSVVENDLPQRLAEVLAQLWQASGAASQRMFDGMQRREVDSSLLLKVRCRFSMSLVYDSVWRWKEQFGAVRNLDGAVLNPTRPEVAPDGALDGVSQNGIGLDQSLGQAAGLGQADDLEWMFNPSGAPFDSLAWALDTDGLGGLPMSSETFV